MKTFRKVLFWCHLTVGVIGGLVILLMSVTGALLTYEKQITVWADTSAYRVSSGSVRLPAETLISKARESQQDPPTSFTVRSDFRAPAAVGFPRGRTVLVDPYTGAVLGEGATGVRSFFRSVTDLHRWLGMQGENRDVARAITGACNLGFLFIVVSGFYLWFPRRWTRAQVRNVAWFRRGLSSKARDFNWHNVIGLWSAVPLFVVVLSGVVISYQWAGNLAYRVVGEDPPAPRPAGPGGPGGPPAPATEVFVDGLDRAWPVAERQSADWQSISVQLPTKADAPVVFSIDSGTGGQPQKRGQLTLDRATGEVQKWEPFSSYTTGRRLRTILRFAHTGEVLGFVGQTIAGLVSLGGAFLVYTGLALAWRRFRAWSARRSGRPAVAPIEEV